MDGLQIYIAIFITIVNKLIVADHEYVVRSPDSRAVPIDFETVLQCSMNIEPDKFQWKFYPLPIKDITNPKAIINLGKSDFIIIPNRNFTSQRKQSDLTVQVDSTTAGDYQCLAYYGASVVASVPWRITITHLGEFPPQQSRDIIVLRGNTVSWRCEPPDSNPEASIEYSNDHNNIPSNLSKSLIIPNVTSGNNGRYYCTAYSLEFKRKSTTTLTLKVVDNYRQQAPNFIVPPLKSYTVNKGASVFLECSAIGNPIPKVIWKKQSGQIPSERTELIPGGLIIKNITTDDDGVYICHHLNTYGEINTQIRLIYNEEPTIDCLSTTTNPTTDLNQGQSADIYCTVKGTPEPQISWFLNGFSVNNDSAIETSGNRIYFRPVEKRHAGNLQIFAQNLVKTVYSSISIRVIPVSTSIDVAVPPPTKTHHRHHSNYHNNHNNNNNSNNKGVNNRKSQKHPKIVIPTKPTVSRLNDHAVMVRWTVPPNQGLPIQFFKVQFRDLGPINNQHEQRKAKPWNTSNPDIAPHIRSYEVNDLKPDHVYRFRIAAVYSNNDNKDSPKSDKFYLRRMDFDKRNPLPIPMITQTEPINSTAVKIYWKCDPPANITINGFVINYVSASSAADYMKATVDGQETNSFILSHLQPDTVYDIKLQSFTSRSASEFSSIMKARTLNVVTITATPVTTSTIKESVTQTAAVEAAGISKLYIIIAVCVLTAGGVLILAIIGLLFYCRKWKQKKSRSDRSDKPAVEDHHIQVDGNDYVVNTKNQSRVNGVLPPNRITITANPLADADNKNQNVIELSCLASQNNNCSTTTTTPSTTQEFNDSSIAKDKDNKNREKRSIRGKNNSETNTSGENYV